tara:strand:+ start:54 stop:1535 length:1482 start_codon:yes stop_codon:yes gene_type:complete
MSWFSLNPKRALQKVSSKKGLQSQLKEIFDSFPDKSESLLAVADDDWKVNSREPWIIKVNAKNYDWITKNYTGGKFTGGKKLYTIMMGNDINIRWRKTKVTPSSPNTQMQELGSAWILERVINDNKTTFKKVQDIVDDKVTYEKLVKIFRGDVPEDWLFTFYAQQKRLFNVYNGNSPYTTFNRDGGFMDYITKICATKFGIAKKDSWNPADIWIIKGSQAKIENEINKMLDGDHQTIYELNDYLRVKYIKKEIMGLSLKKVSGKKAKYEVVNLGDRSAYIDTTDPSMNYPVSAKCFQSNFLIKSGKKNFTQDVRLLIDNGAKKKKIYDFQIKANSPEQQDGSNLKFEATLKGAGGARLGKAPVDQIVEIMNDLGERGFKNNYNEYPGTLDDFQSSTKKGKKYFTNVIKKLIQAGMKTDINDINKIIENIEQSYESPDDRGTNTRCKLMGLDFFYSMLNMGPEKMREFGTDMVYISQKKGTKKKDTFGPFGKVY